MVVVPGQLLTASAVDVLDSSAVAPSAPVLGRLWADTSGAIPVLRVWDGSEWTRVGRSMDEYLTSFPGKVTTVLTGSPKMVWDSGALAVPAASSIRMRMKIIATTSLLTTGSVFLVANSDTYTSGSTLGIFSITSPITAGIWLTDLTISPSGIVQAYSAASPVPGGVKNVTPHTGNISVPVTRLTIWAAAYDTSQYVAPFTITVGPVVLYTTPGATT